MMPRPQIYSAASLRRELSGRNLMRAAEHSHETTYGSVQSVLYAEDEFGLHGNFLPASYKRICADPAWRERLNKSYTASARVPRTHDRHRRELDCSNSSDALLMNIFCYPRVMGRPGVCRLLNIDAGKRPEFGVRAKLAMLRDEVDRTELDMTVGDLLVEAKLTEAHFQCVSLERLLRYQRITDVFDMDELPRSAGGFEGYQLVRGVLAAQAADGRFLLLCDRRRADLDEVWFRVLRAIRSAELRCRMMLLSWQELAAVMPPAVRTFLSTKYGIEPVP